MQIARERLRVCASLRCSVSSPGTTRLFLYCEGKYRPWNAEARVIEASATSSSCGESGVHRIRSILRLGGKRRRISGSYHFPNVKNSHGKATSTELAKPNRPVSASILKRCVVPLRQCPTMMTGGGMSAKAPRYCRLCAFSISDNGTRPRAEAKIDIMRSRFPGPGQPWHLTALIKVDMSAP